jgi:hypothetical protein
MLNYLSRKVAKTQSLRKAKSAALWEVAATGDGVRNGGSDVIKKLVPTLERKGTKILACE